MNPTTAQDPHATWEAQSQAKIDLILKQIMAWGHAMTRDGELPPLPAQAVLLRELYEQALPLARLMDRSQLVLHAEGPGADREAPWLAALKWMTNTTQSVLGYLAREWFYSRGADGKALARKVDWRVTGFAPGSLWLGVRAQAPSGDLLAVDDELIRDLGATLAKLPLVGRFIDDEGLRPDVREAIDDPAQLDVLLDSLRRLAPTGRAGVHTLGVSASEHGQITLSQRERVVINAVLDRPKTQTSQSASFTGEIRAIDLDKQRATLRTADGIIRCATEQIPVDNLRDVLGRDVIATGLYETDRQGRPRMLYAREIRIAEQPQLI